MNLPGGPVVRNQCATSPTRARAAAAGRPQAPSGWLLAHTPATGAIAGMDGGCVHVCMRVGGEGEGGRDCS
jgi:hypothetical protein